MHKGEVFELKLHERCVNSCKLFFEVASPNHDLNFLLHSNVFFETCLFKQLTHFSPMSHFYTPENGRGYRNVSLE